MSNKGTITDLSLKAEPSKQVFFKLCKGGEPKEDPISPSLETVIDTDIIGVEEPASFLAVSLPGGKQCAL